MHINIYFAAGIIVPHQFLMLVVLWPRLTPEHRIAANLNSAQSWLWQVSEDIINCCLLAVITFVIWNMEHG